MLLLENDLRHVVKLQADALFGLVGLGFALSMVLPQLLGWVRAGASSSSHAFKTRILRSFFVVCGLAVWVIATVSYLNRSDSRRSLRWQHLWIFRKNAGFALLLAGMLVGVTMKRLLKVVIHWSGGLCVVPCLFNALLVGSAQYFLSRDSHFVADLEHVLQMRLSAAMVFAGMGLLLGLSLTHILTSFRPLRLSNNRRPRQNTTGTTATTSAKIKIQ
jgi:uncharacterized membrane protein YidH (DUF202 family)